MKRADPELFVELDSGVYRCEVCTRKCTLRSGQKGICGVRSAQDDGIYSTSYGRIVSSAIDPIEKKPLSRFLPGTLTYSVATPGCSLRCPWCQNYFLLNAGLVDTVEEQSPAQVIQKARASGCPSFSFTYSEPTVSLEFVRDCFAEAHNAGLKTVLVTNGNLTNKSRGYLLGYMDATNVDVKTYDSASYRKLGGDLEELLKTLELWIQNDVHVEITTLVIPGYNDDAESFQNFSRVLAQRLGTDVVWHLSAYHPAYLYTEAPPTPLDTLKRLQTIAQGCGFRDVVLGNVRLNR